jgi:hypothetical protein
MRTVLFWSVSIWKKGEVVACRRVSAVISGANSTVLGEKMAAETAGTTESVRAGLLPAYSAVSAVSVVKLP